MMNRRLQQFTKRSSKPEASSRKAIKKGLLLVRMSPQGGFTQTVINFDKFSSEKPKFHIWFLATKLLCLKRNGAWGKSLRSSARQVPRGFFSALRFNSR
jgi:hypothetical protein